MKKIALFLLGLVSVFQLKASHLMGGQTTARNIGGLNYELTLTLYRDQMGVQMPSIETLHIYDSTYTLICDININTISPTWSINWVDKYEYNCTYTFPYVGKFIIAFSNCCRNGSILNLTNPSGANFYLDNVLYVDSSNSSPIFLNDPITLGQIGTPFVYNPLPFDVDGDSLVWVLDNPMNYVNDTIPGFYLPPSDSSTPFNLDPMTGEISFLPSTVGNFQLSIMVIEYRDGIQIGYIRRDMQLIILPSPNNSPIISTNFGTINSVMVVNPGQTFNFNFEAYDPDSQNVSILFNSELLMLTNQPSINTYLTSINDVHSQITWVPSINDVRDRPYTFCFRVAETYGPYTFYHDYTYSLRVENITGVDMTIYKNLFKIYPNPVVDKFSFDYPKQDNPKIYMINSCGQVVMEKKVSTGHNEYDITDISSGLYYVVTDNQVINDIIVKK